jgi:hypothetical protein
MSRHSVFKIFFIKEIYDITELGESEKKKIGAKWLKISDLVESRLLYPHVISDIIADQCDQ